jgi:hypothetical protein
MIIYYYCDSIIGYFDNWSDAENYIKLIYNTAIEDKQFFDHTKVYHTHLYGRLIELRLEQINKIIYH